MFLKITSHKEADQIVPSAPSDLLAVVSIFTPPNSRVVEWEGITPRPVLGFDEFSGHKIALCFDDTVVTGHRVFPPERHDVARFLNWAETVPYPRHGTMLIHCHAGISRSTACALAFLSLKHGPGSEKTCIEHIASIRPQTNFNDLIVLLADELLDRRGALSGAVEAWKAIVKSSKLYG